jgi:hypothetical protein
LNEIPDTQSQETTAEEKALEASLFPSHPDLQNECRRKELFGQYNLLATHVDQLSVRRQIANNFFLSLNSAVFAGMGFLSKQAISETEHPLNMRGIFGFILVLASIGLIISKGWTSIIHAHRELQTANVSILRTMEKHLPVALFSAQHHAGKKHYLSLLIIEERIAGSFILVYIAFLVFGVFMCVFWHTDGRIGFP